MSTGIKLTESLKRTIDLEQRAIADGAVTENRNCTVNSIPYSLLKLKPSLVLTPSAFKAGSLLSIVPNDGTADFGVVRATTAWRRNASGVWESVAANVPRVHYPVGGGCPSCLVEPQRTNLLLHSQDFDNAYWTKFNSTIDSSVITSPIGFGDAIIDDSVNASHRVQRLFSVTSGVTYTQSVYFKKGVNTFGFLGTNNFSFWDFCFIDLNTLDTFLPAGVTANVEVELNGWIRFSVTKTADTTGSFNFVFGSSPTTSSVLYIGAGDISIYLDGAQLEQGSTATSIIPTTTTTVTRNADVISKTGVSSLIGQTEGSVFIDFNYNKKDTTDNFICVISNNTGDNGIWIDLNISNIFLVLVRVGGTTVISFGVPAASFLFGRKKIMLNYKSGNTSLFVNGVQISTTSTAAFTFPVTIGKINIGSFWNGSGHLNNEINNFYLTTTRLTDSQAIQLTTI